MTAATLMITDARRRATIIYISPHQQLSDKANIPALRPSPFHRSFAIFGSRAPTRGISCRALFNEYTHLYIRKICMWMYSIGI